MVKISEEEWLNLMDLGWEKFSSSRISFGYGKFLHALMGLEAVHKVYTEGAKHVLWPETAGNNSGDPGLAIRTLAYLGKAPGCVEVPELVEHVCGVLWDYCFRKAQG